MKSLSGRSFIVRQYILPFDAPPRTKFAAADGEPNSISDTNPQKRDMQDKVWAMMTIIFAIYFLGRLFGWWK